MVRKIIIAAFLLVLVLGFSYLKVVRNSDTAQPATEEIAAERPDTMPDAVTAVPAEETTTVAQTGPEQAKQAAPPKPDTLSDALKQTIRDYCQSVFDRLPPDLTISERTAAAQNIVKETASRFAMSERKVSRLWQPPELTPAGSDVADSDEAGETPPPKTPSIADRVETLFKRRTAELPSDLTEIEKRIALDEIRKETADELSLSLDEVYDIWQERKLTSVSAAALDDVGIEKKTVPENDEHRRRIASYYRERFDSLPSNLTQYERTVAIAELKYQTAAHFSISLSEFEKIWQEYNQSDS